MILRPRSRKGNHCVMNRQQPTSIPGKHKPENRRVGEHRANGCEPGEGDS